MAYWLDPPKYSPHRKRRPPPDPRAIWYRHPLFFQGRLAVLNELAREREGREIAATRPGRAWSLPTAPLM